MIVQCGVIMGALDGGSPMSPVDLQCPLSLFLKF